MSQRFRFFLASSLGAVSVLMPLPALSQSGCDPNTSYCGATSDQQQQQQQSTYGLGSNQSDQTNPSQSPYGNSGGYNGGRVYGNGAQQSLDLQQVPTYLDNLNPNGARQQNGLSQLGQLGYGNYPRSIVPDQPTEFQRLVSASVGTMLPIFGAKLFLQSPSTFAPVDQVPVTSNYVVGPGDQLLIRVWGQINFNAEVTVDRTGTVYLPQIGAIHVGGTSYDQLQTQVHSNIARIYKNFSLSVNLGQLHPIRIFVTGQARRPGTYTVSSLSTLVSAIFATGGPAPQGSLRHILLRRNGVTVGDFDMYDLLVNGDKSHDLPLLPGDVIYIPPVGPQVAVYGSVRTPAIYELTSPEGELKTPAGELKSPAGSAMKQATVGDLLADAGGLSNLASLTRASLERIDPEQHQRAVDIALDAAGKETAVRDGDILRVLPISPRFDQTVTVRGNLEDPGRFGWHPGMRLSELLPNSQALVTRNYWQRRNQLGLPSPVFAPDYTQRFTAYRSAQADNQRQYLLSLQREQIRKQFNQQQDTRESQLGVQDQNAPATNPTPTPLLDPNALANDPNAADMTGLQTSPDSSQSLGFGPGQQSQNGQNTASSPNNTIGGGALADQQQRTRTENTAAAGTLNTVKLAAPEIDWSYAVIERMDPVTLKTRLIPFDLGKLVMQHDASQDLAVEPHDVITIFSQADIRVPQLQQTKLIQIEGEVEHAGIYSAEPGESLRHLVERAGGLTTNAYLFGAELTRESARVVQQQRLDDYVTQLELDVDRASARTAASALTPQDQSAATASLASTQLLVTRLRGLRANGRIVLTVDPDSNDVSSLPEMPMEDGDHFIVPSRPSSVNVVGAVYTQSSFLYTAQRRVYGYLKQAGGANRDADPSHAFVVRADGSILSHDSAKTFWGNEFNQARVHPGDTLVMPEKVYRGSGIRNILDFSTLFSSLALGAGALSVITN